MKSGQDSHSNDVASTAVATAGRDDELHRQYSALMIQVADERHAFSEVRLGVENLRSAAESALNDLQEAKRISGGLQQLQLSLTSAELRLSSLEQQAQVIGIALSSIDRQLERQRQEIAEHQRLISEFLSVVRHPQIVKLLRGALRLKDLKHRLPFRGKQAQKGPSSS